MTEEIPIIVKIIPHPEGGCTLAPDNDVARNHFGSRPYVGKYPNEARAKHVAHWNMFRVRGETITRISSVEGKIQRELVVI